MTSQSPIKIEANDVFIEEVLGNGKISFHFYKNKSLKTTDEMFVIIMKNVADMHRFLAGLNLDFERYGNTQLCVLVVPHSIV